MADDYARPAGQPARDQEPLFAGGHHSSTDGLRQPQTNETHQSPTTVASQSPTDGSTLYSASDLQHADGLIAKVEEGTNTSIFDGSRTNTLISDKPPSSSNVSLWKTKALHFAPVRHIVSIVTGDRAESLHSSSHAPKQPRPWRTTLIRFGPLSGIFCMLLAIACIFASLGILAGSDHQPVVDWSAPPSTYLAIFTAIANLSMRYAALQGVVIAWWFRAIQGSTLAKLHWDWRSGTTLRGALTAGRHMGLLGLACIFSTVVVIDGPLLQRSTEVVPAPYVNQTIPLNINIAQEIPTGFTGGWSKDPGQRSAFPYTLAFNDTIPTNNGNASNYITAFDGINMFNVTRAWYDQSPLYGVVRGCNGTCKAKIRAPALFPTTCKTHLVPLNYRGQFKTRPVIEQVVAPPLEHDAFLIAPSLLVGQRETVNLITGFSTQKHCEGTLNYSICTLEAGIGEYEVTVDHDKIPMETLPTPTLVTLANNTAVNHTFDQEIQGHHSTLAGIVNVMNVRYASYLFYYPWKGTVTGFEIGPSGYQQYGTYRGPNELCYSFTDPREDMLQNFNKLMFYAGAVVAAYQDLAYLQSHIDPGLPINTTATGYLQGDHNVFQTDYKFFVIAAIVELVCIALVAPTYWGWWKLGRPMSFSPLETAKAFKSPMLAEFNSNSSGRDLANAVGEKHVQYGASFADPMGQTVQLAFANPALVTPPRKGSRFDV